MRSLFHSRNALVLVAALFVLWGQAPAPVTSVHVNAKLTTATCTTTLSSGGNIGTAITNATSGDAICLGAGSYSAVNVTVTKTSYVTVRAADGVSASSVTINGITLNSSQFLKFQNITIGTNGSQVGTFSTNANHIVLDAIAFSGGLCVNWPQDINSDTTISNSTFTDLGQSPCGDDGRLEINGVNDANHGGSVSSGIVVTHNLMNGSAGCSDGLHFRGGPTSVIVTYNEFADINQGACVSHADSFQPFGASHTTVVGNYFHDSSTAIMDPDCNGGFDAITDNVFANIGAQVIQIAGENNINIQHNTSDGTYRLYEGNPVCAMTGVVFKNNIGTGLSTGTVGTGTWTVTFNNGITGLNGGSTIAGTPTYVGGASPSTWAGWALTGGSVGHTAGDDGQDIGARIATLPTPGPQ